MGAHFDRHACFHHHHFHYRYPYRPSKHEAWCCVDDGGDVRLQRSVLATIVEGAGCSEL